MTTDAPSRTFTSFLQEFSIPLIGGVIAAMAAANISSEGYHHFLAEPLPLFGFSLHFLVNDIFMVLFFGIAAKEITESCLPGGDLNPPGKAINPLLGTMGGVVGPIAVYLGIVHAFGGASTYGRGWGIPTATDIALAWLVARMVFGKGHPAVNFLLLLAVADDAIGLGIIAIFYPDPRHPVEPTWLILTAGAMVFAYGLRRMNVRRWYVYILGPGIMSWIGLHSAHLHPALALVFVVPFLPCGRRDNGLFADSDAEYSDEADGRNAMHDFEHSLKVFVDFGLFFFAYANAGVEFSYVGAGTWYVLLALLVGKTVGITTFSWVGTRLGFPLPSGMNLRHLVLAGLVAGVGLTVALFVAEEAFRGRAQAEAKMGALFSVGIAVAAILLGRLLNAKELAPATTACDRVREELAIAEANVAARCPVPGATEAGAGVQEVEATVR